MDGMIQKAPNTLRGLHRAMRDILRAQLDLAEKKDIVNTMDFDWVASEEWADEIYKATHGLIRQEAVIGAESAARRVGVEITDYVDRPRVVAALKRHNYRFAFEVNRTTKRMLADSLEAGTQAGETIPQLSDRVKSVFGFSDEENYRAERIARTETARAHTTGEVTGWKETGVVDGTKWDASSDSCPFCQAMHDRYVDIGGIYVKRGGAIVTNFDGERIKLSLDYSDVAGPPLHPNCRCVLMPVLVGEKSFHGVTFKGGSGNHGHEGIPGVRGGSMPTGISSRAKRALMTHKPMTKDILAKASAVASRIAGALGGEQTPDNEPMDCIVGKYGFEIKTIVRGKNDKITTHPESRQRKEKFVKKHGLKGGTIAIDTRRGKWNVYFHEGFGAFRLKSMILVATSPKGWEKRLRQVAMT